MILRRIFEPVLIVVLALAVIVAILEAGIRLFRPQRYFAVCINQWDREVGTNHIPGIKGFIVCPEYEIDLAINSKGLRDREFPYEKPEGITRILCLGDSYTCGYGVQAEKTFPKVLETTLNGESGKTGPWEVLNAGVGSTGTAHQLAYFITEGHLYDPDLVVVCFCPANDFNDNVISGLFSIVGDTLARHGAPETSPRKLQRIAKLIPGYNTFLARSHFWNFFKHRLAVLHHGILHRKAAPTAERQGQPSEESRHMILAKRLMEVFDKECTARGSRLVVMNIPPAPVDPIPAWTAKLSGYMRSKGIPVLDLAPFFEDKDKRNVVTSYPIDGHWTREGHRLAAEELRSFLVEWNLIKDGTRVSSDR